MPWTIVAMQGFRINSPYLAHDPQCPTGRHPTRHCGCKVFKTMKDAEAYITEKEAATRKEDMNR